MSASFVPPSAQSTIRLGTRASQLALVQSRWVKTQLESLGHVVELIEIKTEGDVQTGPLAQIGGQGLFTKRLQIALLGNEIDLAVHSLKDLPTEDHPGLTIGAVPTREDPGDALISLAGYDLNTLPDQAMVGTGSVRRAAQLLFHRPDLKVADIRGNVDTRLKKLESGPFDAIVLACAGLRRLGLTEKITYAFPTDQILPAVGQGCLGLEVREGDESSLAAIGHLNHVDSYARAMAERAMLRTLFAGCLAPVGAMSTVAEDKINLIGVVLSRDGKQRIEASASSSIANAVELGIEVAEKLVAAGADKWLREAR